uniref:ATP-dependent Clp protease proteolytic subunit n=1 Tax=Gossypium raimondii TaxID=29730 RepID=A0A0D2S642_GOSRA|nr:hypothetical protein B456_013G004600 [Gossypium raimondii]
MIHQPGSSFYDVQTGEFILKAKELLKLHESLTRVYVLKLREDIERDVFMSTIEAQAHGIVNLVAIK